MDEKAQYIKEEANKAYNDLRISLLQKGEAIYLTAFGGSMYPFIKNGDEIKIEPVSAEGIKVGDIVAVDRGTENSPRFLVHRVVMIKGGGPEKVYFTKGDAHNNKTLEGPVAIGSIIGTAARIKRRGLDIDLQTSLWRHLDRYVGWLSLKYPEILIYLSACVNIILERRSLLAKVKKRLKSGDPVICNTEKLILICARKDPSDELIKEAQELIGDGVDWEQFCRLAFKSQAAVLVYNSLKMIGPTAGMPQYVLDKLKEAYFYSLGSAHCQHRESQDLLKLLSEKDIAVIPLKGTFLSKRIYGCIESRGTNIDVDIFIKWNDREKLHNVLTENGYVFSPSEETKDWLWQENCTSPGSQLIDVLYDIWLRGTCKEAIAGLWAGARRVTDGDGLKYYRFGQEELLIYMSQCLVTSDDGYKCLKYICDVNEFLNLHSRELDWESVIEKVKKWHLRRSLYTALSLAGNLYDNDLPPSVMNSTKPGLFKRIFIKTFFNRKVILKENFRRRFMDKFLSYTFFELIEASSAAEYWRVVKRTLLPPKEVMLSNKNYSSKPLYAEYALRLFRSFSRLFYDGQV